MAVITYTAKRNIVQLSFSAAGIDFFADSADNSFNSNSTGLLGLFNGDWIKVEGNGLNNGWHQVTADSTTSKIQVASSLADETSANVMMQGYLHGMDQQYTLEFNASVLDKSSKRVQNVATALDGSTDTLLHRIEKRWSVQVGAPYVDAADLPLWEEAMDSVSGGEEITFDPYGSVTDPDIKYQVILIGDYQIPRRGRLMKYQPTFRVKQV